MKFVSVVLGVMVSAACSPEPGSEALGSEAPGETDDVVGSVDLASSFEMFRRGDDRGSGPPAIQRAIRAGATRLAALQADTIGDNARNGLVDTDPDDGGWDFTVPSSATSHTPAVSPPNLYGETGLGAWAAVRSGNAGPRALTVALDTTLAMQGNPDIDSPPDFLFAVLIAELADNPGFAEVARQHYDARRAANGGAAGLGTFIRDARHARNQDGLIPYDVGWLLLSAAGLDAAFPGAGYDADANTYAGIVVDDLTAATPMFDIDDPSEAFYVIGLGWAQVAADWLGEGPLFRRVRVRLLAEQKANGAWGTNAGEPADDLQSTAIAVETLALTDRETPRTRRAVRAASRFLLGAQAANGGWPDAAGNELPLVDAEIILGLMLARTDAGDEGVLPAPEDARPAGPEAPRVLAAPIP